MERQQSSEARLLDLSDFKLGGTTDVDEVFSGDVLETASAAVPVSETVYPMIYPLHPNDMMAMCDMFDAFKGDPVLLYGEEGCESVDGCDDPMPDVDVPSVPSVVLAPAPDVDVPGVDVSGVGVVLAPDEWVVEDDSEDEEPCAKRAKVAAVEVAQVVTKVDGVRVDFEVEVQDEVRVEVQDEVNVEVEVGWDEMRMVPDSKLVKLNVCWQLANAALGSSKHEFNVQAVEKLREETVENGPYVFQRVLRAVSGRSGTMEPLHELCKAGGYEGIWGNLSSKIVKEGSLHGLGVGRDKGRVFFFLDE